MPHPQNSTLKDTNNLQPLPSHAYSARSPHCPLQFASGMESSKQKHFSVHKKTNENTGKTALGNDFV